jgi:hypothetical protein
MSELHRGQHPHMRPGGNYNVKSRIFESSGPIAWDDRIEIERCMWEERGLPPLGQNYNPIAQYDVLSAGNLDAQAKVRRQQKGTTETAYATNDLALSQMSKLQRSQIDRDGDGQFSATELAAHGFNAPVAPPQPQNNIPRARDKSNGASALPLGTLTNRSAYSTKPPTFRLARERYGISSETSRASRMAELEVKFGVDKVKASFVGRVDTTPQAGHNTAATGAGSPSSRSSTVRTMKSETRAAFERSGFA